MSHYSVLFTALYANFSLFRMMYCFICKCLIIPYYSLLSLYANFSLFRMMYCFICKSLIIPYYSLLSLYAISHYSVLFTAFFISWQISAGLVVKLGLYAAIIVTLVLLVRFTVERVFATGSFEWSHAGPPGLVSYRYTFFIHKIQRP